MSVTDGVMTVIPPPPGYVVDFDHPQRNGDTAIYWVAGIGNLLALLFVSQRFYVNAWVRRKLGLDDACLMIAWIFCVVIQALIVRASALKFIGVHAWEIPIDKFQDFVKFNVYLNPIIYAPPTALAKLVLLLFYRQLQNQQKWFMLSVYTVMAINVGSNAGIFFSSIFACRPIAAGWDITITDAKCINRPVLFQTTAALGVATDVFIILIPIPMVIKLQMSRAKKAGLLAMFTIGSATVITSVVRLVLLITILGDIDQPWGGGPVSVWICVEANLLIMCASLPTLRLFFRTVAPNLMFSSGGNSKTTPGYPGGISSTRNTRGLQTIGSSASRINPKKNHYGRFDDEEYHMEMMVTGGPRNKESEGRKGGYVNDGISSSSREFGEDGTSETGIIQTKTMQVTYEEAR